MTHKALILSVCDFYFKTESLQGERSPLPPLHSLQLGDFSPTTNSSSHTHVHVCRHTNAAEVQEVTVHTLTAHKGRRAREEEGNQRFFILPHKFAGKQTWLRQFFPPVLVSKLIFPSPLLSNCPVCQGEICTLFSSSKGARFPSLQLSVQIQRVPAD